MLDRLARFLLRIRYVTWLAAMAMGLAFLVLPPVQFDQSIEAFFPNDHPALKDYQRTKAAFGGDQIVFVAYDDPRLWTQRGMQRIRQLADQIQDVPSVERIDSLDEMPVPWRVHEAVEALASRSFSFVNLARLVRGRTTVSGAVESLEDDPERLAEFRRRICAHPLFNGLLVSPTGETTALLVRLRDPLEHDHAAAIGEIRRLADQFVIEQDLESIAVAGPPVLVVDGVTSLERDNRILGAVAMVLMALTMLIAVRNPAWALLPLVAGWAVWQLMHALLDWFGLRLTLSSGPIIAQTVVLCMPTTSHLAVRFYEMVRHGVERRSAALQSLVHLFVPILWSTLTAAAGYLAAWAVADVRPIAQFGIMMFFSNLAAGALTYALGPGAMLIGGRRAAATATQVAAEEHTTRVGAVTAWILAHPGRMIAAMTIPFALTLIGTVWLQFESNYVNSFRSNSRVVRDYRYVESRMGGIGLVEILFPTPDPLTLEFVERIDACARQLDDVDPELISGVVSLADLLGPPTDVPGSESSESQSDDEVDPREVLSLKLRVLGTPAYSQYLDNLWDSDSQTTRLLIRVQESAPAERKERAFAGMVRIVRNKLDESAFLTGLSYLMTQITRSVIATSFDSTELSAAVILVMLWIAFRSLGLAILALLPTLLAVGFVLGLMGWLGLKIDMSTALVAGIAIGLSVDDAFHCLLRWKDELRHGRTPTEALQLAYAGSGPAVLLSSSAVSLGFLSMVWSEFVPMANFGWLVAVATFGGSLGNLVLTPAVLAVLCRRKERKGKQQHVPASVDPR